MKTQKEQNSQMEEYEGTVRRNSHTEESEGTSRRNSQKEQSHRRVRRNSQKEQSEGTVRSELALPLLLAVTALYFPDVSLRLAARKRACGCICAVTLTQSM